MRIKICMMEYKREIPQSIFTDRFKNNRLQE